MKTFTYCLTLACLIFTNNISAQTYNYGQKYNSINNTLVTQRESWRQVEKTYNSMYSNRETKTYNYSYPTSTPTYSSRNPNQAADYYDKPKKQNSYDWDEDNIRYSREQTRRNTEAAERLQMERQREQQRIAAEYEKLMLEKERKARAEQEQRLLVERLAYYKSRQPALKEDPLQTIYAPPVFNNSGEKYKWYYDQAYNLSGINDPYASLIVAQMALDGEGCTPKYSIAFDRQQYQPYCGLKICLGADIMLAQGNNSDLDIDIILTILKNVTDYTDKTNGHIRAYKELLNFYRSGIILSKKMPKDLGTEADVYAFAARQGDAKALQDVKTLIAQNMDSLQNFSEKQLESLAKTFSVKGADADFGLFIWYKFGQKMQAKGNTACFDAYAKSFDAKGASAVFIQAMQARLLYLSVSDERFFNKLTALQQLEMVQNAKAYATSFEGYKQKKLMLRPDDLDLLFKFYNGSCGLSPNVEKATAIAMDLLLQEKDFSAIQKVAIAYHTGVGGWPKDDIKAVEIFKNASENIPEKSKTEIDAKADFMATTADLWADTKKYGIQTNIAEVNFYLSEAARLNNAYAEEYADWAANKFSRYYSKEKAAANYDKAILQLEKLHRLYAAANMEDMVTAKRMEEIRKKKDSL